MLVKTLTPSINISLNLEKGLWNCMLDSDDLDNSVLNICINAMHAMNGHGQLTMSTSNVSLSKKQATELSLKEKEYILHVRMFFIQKYSILPKMPHLPDNSDTSILA